MTAPGATLRRVLIRIRWFLLGAGATMWGALYVATKLRKVRGGMTAAGLRRAAVWAAADLLEVAGKVLQGGGEPRRRGPH